MSGCFPFTCAGVESQHEAPVPSDHRTSVQQVSQAGEIQEIAVLSVLLPLRTTREEEIPHVGMEHSL